MSAIGGKADADMRLCRGLTQNCHDLRYHAAIGALADQLPTSDFIEFELLRKWEPLNWSDQCCGGELYATSAHRISRCLAPQLKPPTAPA